MGKVSAISELNRSDYNEAVDQLDRVICAKDGLDARRSWNRAQELAMLCLTRDRRNADFRYLLGYIYFKSPSKTEATRRRAKSFLRAAINLDPNHNLARYCLACLFFDLQRYEPALLELRRLPAEVFREIGQAWRWIKTSELRLCCSLYIAPDGSWLDEAEKLSKDYRWFDDPLLAPLPTELAECLESLLKRRELRDSEMVQLCEICSSILIHLGAADLLEERWPLIHNLLIKHKWRKGVAPY